MKIAIVCGHYMPAMGYLEVHLSKALVQLGHEVSVVTSTEIPSYVSDLHQEYGSNPEGVSVVRLKPKFSLGQIVICPGVSSTVQAINPDLIIVIGLGKRFPKPVFNLNYPIISLFGDNAHSYADLGFVSRLKTKVLFEIFKRSTYASAIEKSTELVAYTPESFEAAGKMLGGKYVQNLAQQKNHMSLGFWNDEFYFDSKGREELRHELDWDASKKIVITATRIKAEKRLEEAIGLFEKLPEEYVWLLLGSAEDAYSDSLKSSLAKRLGEERFRMMPFQGRSKLNAFYNAADVALYTVPAISVFEALGTGLPGISFPEGSMRHIPGQGVSWYFGEINDNQSAEAVKGLDLSEPARMKRTNAASARFSWKRIAGALIEKVH